MKRLITFIFIIHFLSLFAQEDNISSGSIEEKKKEVSSVINKFFAAMKDGDSAIVHSLFHPAARLMSAFSKEGSPVLVEETINEFLKKLGTPHEKVWDERIHNLDIQINENLASAWMDYSFYLGDKLHHCGVNSFQLFQTSIGWKIIQITDTRQTDNCLEN